MPDLVFATKGQAEAIRAHEALKRQAEELRGAERKVALEAAAFQKALVKIFETAKTPAERLKIQMDILRKSIKDGVAPPEALQRLEQLKEKYQETFTAARKEVTRSTLTLEELEATQKKTLDPTAIVAWGKGFAAVAAGPIALIASTMRELRSERERYAEDSKAAIAGEGQLAQFADNPAQMAALLAESRAAHGLGVGRDRGTAAVALGSMIGAGIENPQDRLTLMRMQASGLVDNAGEVAKAAKTLQSTYGGPLLPMLDRAFGAGDIAPGGASQLMVASSRSALTAKALGMVPDEVVAGTAALAAGTGSENEGATLLDALLRALDKAGGFKGKSLNTAINEITQRVAAGENLRGDTLLGGRAEAVRAYRFLAGDEGKELYKQALTGSYQGVQANAGFRKLQLAESADPNLAAARFNIVQEQARAARQIEQATFTNIAGGVQQAKIGRTAALPLTLQPFARAALTFGHSIQGMRDPETVAREHANDPLYRSSPANVEARKLIESVENQREIQSKMLRVLESLDNKSSEGGLIISND